MREFDYFRQFRMRRRFPKYFCYLSREKGLCIFVEKTASKCHVRIFFPDTFFPHALLESDSLFSFTNKA